MRIGENRSSRASWRKATMAEPMWGALGEAEVVVDGERRRYALFATAALARTHIADHVAPEPARWECLHGCHEAHSTCVSLADRYAAAIRAALRFGAAHPLALETTYRGPRMEEAGTSETFVSLDGVVVHARDGVVRTAYLPSRGRGFVALQTALLQESARSLRGDYLDRKGGGVAYRELERRRTDATWSPSAWSLPRWRALRAAEGTTAGGAMEKGIPAATAGEVAP
jgi:hypothetical protein